MNLLVTTKSIDLPGFTTVKSLENVDWTNVETLIFHDSVDKELVDILALTKAREYVKKKIFINNNLKSMYFVLFQGMDAAIYNDESFLDDIDILLYIVESYKETGLEVVSEEKDLETINRYISDIAGSGTDLVKKYLESEVMQSSIRNTLANIENSLSEKQEREIAMVSFFEDVLEFTDTLTTTQSDTSEKLQELQKYLEEVEMASGKGRENLKFIFKTYNVPNTVSSVLYIRALEPTIYLESFILSYVSYLNNDKRKRAKVLIAVPMLKQLVDKYRSISNLSPETVKSISLKDKDVFVTHEPTVEVLTKFFKTDLDVHIVIDLMYGEKLLTGTKVKTINSVSGLSKVFKDDLRQDRTITPITGMPSMIVIPLLSQYTTKSEVQKLNQYATEIAKQKLRPNITATAYEKLDLIAFSKF